MDVLTIKDNPCIGFYHNSGLYLPYGRPVRPVFDFVGLDGQAFLLSISAMYFLKSGRKRWQICSQEKGDDSIKKALRFLFFLEFIQNKEIFSL